MRTFALLAFTLAACASDPPKLSSQDEALVMAQMFSMAGTAQTAAGQPAAAFRQAPVVVQVNESQACAFGGSAAVAGMASGSVDSMTGTGSVSVDIMATFTNCGVGQNFVVNGAPDLSLTAEFDYLSFALSHGSVTFSGAFCWNDCSAGNTCDVDVSFQLPSSTQAQPSGSGHICNTQVNFGH